jgi:hypothetical protein
MLSFPAERPDAAANVIWSIQNTLLNEVEKRLGSRDTSKQICQPIFGKGGPHIIVSFDFKQAYAKLSLNAAGFWPTAVYELAHETVHLLNPITGPGTVLEEGVAETFALEMAESLGGFKQASSDCYKEAYGAVAALGPDVFAMAKMVREKCGSLNDITVLALQELFASAKTDLIEKLVAKFERK